MLPKLADLFLVGWREAVTFVEMQKCWLGSISLQLNSVDTPLQAFHFAETE